MAIPLVAFMFLLGATGLLLAWKDQLQFKPKTQEAIANNRALISLDRATIHPSLFDRTAIGLFSRAGLNTRSQEQ